VTELPTGTVTFLFTDVEGSTKLLREHGDAYAELLAQHRRALRDAFAAHGGVEVDTQGDAFFVAFARASDAVAAAREAQAALDNGPVRVRIGVHTGEPVVTGEGYVGMDVHRAARIAAAGHGGQVLVSEATARLLDPSNGLLLGDLGEHRLKDLSAPERLFQLGDAQFPALKTLYQTNLPIPATPVVGRDEEIDAVTRLLARDDVRLTTLTGPGGCGKTRLALAAAGEAADRYPDGVRWVALAPIRQSALVDEAIADAVGADDGSVPAAIGRRRLLLLLDNFEHVIDAAPLVSELVGQCPQLDVLVTSRERLGIAGEHEYETPTLARRDAVALFVQRARTLRSKFVADEDVARVCEQLDDLPLAVELAAARVKVFTPRQLVERLGRRLDLLKGGRGADPRQATLRAAIEWSHDLLDAEEQETFARLGVFVGGWTIDLAEEICDADTDVLEALVDKSLVRTRDLAAGMRFWMLETIREFAVERLAASGEEDVRRRHAETFARLVTEADDAPYGAERTRLFEALGEELPNLRASLGWARAAREGAVVLRICFGARNLLSRSRPADLRAAVEDGLTCAPDDPLLRSAALGVAAFAAYRAGDLVDARRLGQEAVDLARAADDQRLVGFSLNALAAVDVAEGGLADARGRYEEAARLFEAVGDTRALAILAHNRADLELQAGAYDAAARYVDHALASMSALDDRDGLSTSYVNAATARLLLGETDAAADFARSGLDLAMKLESAYDIASDLVVLAAVAAEGGRPRHAGVLCAAADELLRAAGIDREATEAMIHERVLSSVGDSEVFAAGMAHGRTLGRDAVVELALGDRDA
jgi:predicted ATPase/class 3 adenylate cyclase